MFFPVSEFFFRENFSVARRFMNVDPLPSFQIVQSLTPRPRTAEFRAAIQPLAPVCSSAVMTDTLSLENEQSAVAITALGMQPSQHASKVLRVLPGDLPFSWVLLSSRIPSLGSWTSVDTLPPFQIVQSLTPRSRTAEFMAAIQPSAPVCSSVVMTDTLSLENEQSAVAITAPGMQPSQHVSKVIRTLLDVFFPISELFFRKNCSVARRFINVADPLPPLQIVQSLTPRSRTAEFRAAIQPSAPVCSSAVMTDKLFLETEQSAVAKTAPGMQPSQHVSMVIRVLLDVSPCFWVLFSRELFSRSTFHECWSSCFFPDCPIVDSSPMNGRVHGSDSTFGSCVQFSCNEGHTLFGDRTICCSENGTWNATKPTCFNGN